MGETAPNRGDREMSGRLTSNVGPNHYKLLQRVVGFYLLVTVSLFVYLRGIQQ